LGAAVRSRLLGSPRLVGALSDLAGASPVGFFVSFKVVKIMPKRKWNVRYYTRWFIESSAFQKTKNPAKLTGFLIKNRP
jgi:hypothetical protein